MIIVRIADGKCRIRVCGVMEFIEFVEFVEFREFGGEKIGKTYG